ncbi:MAG TPA: TldD/PmbA family protein [Candidatus Cloacimonadota bacterium]|nr:TldD/PmbA family protein [Candidatus Cloacimonadota bacterium]
MDYSQLAMDTALQLGAEYADIRIQNTHSEVIFIRNLSVKALNEGELFGYGIRVFKNGAWGFAHNNIFTSQAVQDTVKKAMIIALNSAKINKKHKLHLSPERSYKDKFKSPMQIDPFKISVKDKVDSLLEVSRTLLSYAPIKVVRSYVITEQNEKIFASSSGTYLDLKYTHITPMYSATAVTEKDTQSRSFNPGGRNAGWEYMEELDLLGNAPRVAEEAIMKVNAETLKEEKRRDLILDPANLSLTMHESVGHPTELDRVLGWEADYAGISFATPEKLGVFQYGSPIVNFLGDNLLPNGLATLGYDDDGVPGQKWYIIKDGILNEYGSTRDTIDFINGQLSRGCNRATYYFDFPINRIPNLYLEAGKKELSPSQLINDTEDGIIIEGQGSFSIDQHRVNFQFGGDLFWEIKNGKKTRMLKKVLYKSNNPEFWNSCDAICDQRYWKSWGVSNCGKGQPPQTGRMTHGAAPSRFRKIRVGGSQ